MDVRVEHHPRRGDPETVQVVADADVLTLVRQLGLHPDAVLVVRHGEPIPVDAVLGPGDEVKIVRVVSGGWR